MFTTRIRLMLFFFGAVILASTASATDSREIFSVAEAAKLIGKPATGPVVIGPEQDEDAPAQATHWTYRAQDSAVVVSRLEFASAAEARKFATPSFIEKQNDEEGAKVTAEPGVGDKAYWSVTEEGCALSFLKGPYIASVAIGGRDIGSPDDHKAALKAAAIAIAAKL